MKAAKVTALFFLVMFIVGLFGAGGDVFVIGVCVLLWYWTIQGGKWYATRNYKKVKP